jgi:dihydropyrimidinase
MHNYDVAIRGGTVITESVTARADVGIRGEQIAAIGIDLPPGTREIDARGKLVMPGGVDSHAHIEQFSSNGIQTSDDWENGTRSAAFGGTTTVIAFAAQHLGMNLAQVVEDYSAQARKGAIIDYAFHMIVADPTDVREQQVVETHRSLPRGSVPLFAKGCTIHC